MDDARVDGLPIVVCFDIEPDRRVPDRRPAAMVGFEEMVGRLPALRDEIATLTGSVPRFNWALRMDPQIEEIYGDPAWVAERYSAELDRFVDAGDELGIHPHVTRWRDGWVADFADADWVAACVETSLDAYRDAFGRRCQLSRMGDRFFSDAVGAQLEAAHVVVDLSIEPGLPAVQSLAPDEVTTGWLPDTTSAPTFAYRPSETNFLVPDPGKPSGMVLLPLTPGATISRATVNDAERFTGTYQTLELWAEPHRFERLLRRRLGAPHLSHLAFAVRTDTALSPGLWAAVETNLATVARVVRGGRWLPASVSAVAAIATTGPGTTESWSDAELWSSGTTDPGFREGAEAVADPDEPPIEWTEGTQFVRCPVCRTDDDGDRVAQTRPAVRVGSEVIRCRTCASVVIPGSFRPETWDAVMGTDNPIVDRYIEYHGALEVIAGLVTAAGARPGGRLLDIGCGYGFAVDVARFAFGVSGVGLDPSPVAARGRRELGVDLRQIPFNDTVDLGEAFDVVVAAEVIEHVADPTAFLTAVQKRLTADGIVVLSTPDAAAIDPSRSPIDAVAAIGTAHPFLFSAEALEALLLRSGFSSVWVEAEGATLRALASPVADGFSERSGMVAPDLRMLREYCIDRRNRSTPGSALHVGMADRAARFALHTGDLDAAATACAHLRSAVVDRHGWDIDDPARARAAMPPGGLSPVVADAHYTSGMLALLLYDDAAQAAEQFHAASLVAEGNSRESRDPSLKAMQLRAIGHEAIARARCDPEQVPLVVDALIEGSRDDPTLVDVDVLVGRAFTELVVGGGHFDTARALRPALKPLHDQIGRERADPVGDELRRTALDSLFSDSMLALHDGDIRVALHGFARGAQLATGYADPHAQQMVELARKHEALARERLVAASAVSGR